jgi:TRAP-type transport system periplasmic protein
MGSLLESRRGFVAGNAAALAAFSIARSAAKAAEFEFKCGSDLGLDHPSVVRMTQMWNAIEKESGGRVHTQLFPDNALGAMPSMFTQVRAGALHFLLLGASNMSSVVPLADISNLGFAGRDDDESLRIMDGPLGGFVRGEVAAKGLYALSTMWNGGMYEVGMASHAVRSPDDLHGMKIRVATSKIAVDLFKAFGAIPSPINLSDVYSGLQTKLIDGESAPLVAIQASHFFEVNRFIALTNHAWSGQWMISNQETWKRLPPDLQGLIERNATKYALLQRRDTKLVTSALIDKMTRLGVAINRVDQTPFRSLLKPYYQTFAGEFGPRAWGLLQTSLGRNLS